jgi:hypothetical protein
MMIEKSKEQGKRAYLLQLRDSLTGPEVLVFAPCEA